MRRGFGRVRVLYWGTGGLPSSTSTAAPISLCSSADGRYVLVFNGEIYNYRQLRTELENQEELFRTTSDSEVLLALYARMGERMLPRLRGMFAFAIWDSHLRELFLARDPYGIKPLYYAQTKEGVLFASQVRALIASGRVSTEIESAGMAGFYLWGTVPEPWTIFRGIMSLPAGSWMRIQSSIPSSPIKWHDIRESWNQEQIRCTEEEIRSASAPPSRILLRRIWLPMSR